MGGRPRIQPASVSVRLRQEEVQRLTSNPRRDGGWAIEFAVADIVAGALRLRDDPAAALLHREDLIAGAVRDEEARAVPPRGRRHASRREGEDVTEQVAVGDPDRERVGGAVGEAADRQARRVDGVPVERLLQRPVDEGDIRPPAT